MEVNELLIEVFGRVTDHVHGAVDGLDAETLARSPGSDTNPVGWLVWHLLGYRTTMCRRCSSNPSCGRPGTGPIASASMPIRTTRGTDTAPTRWPASVPRAPTPWSATTRRWPRRTTDLLARTTAADLDRVVDRRWDPPVTLGVRLVSIADDDIQHAGQAAYARGLLDL